MHELSLVASLFDILEEEARRHKATRIIRVRLKVGRLSGAVPELLESAFEAYKKGTIAAEARLEVEVVQPRFRCRDCGGERLDEEGGYGCVACGGRNVELLEGRDLVVDRVELEADDTEPSGESRIA